MAKKTAKKVTKKAPAKKSVKTKAEKVTGRKAPVDKGLAKKKSKTQANKEAKIQNAQAAQDVAPEDTELGQAIEEAHKDQIINVDQVDSNKAPDYQTNPNRSN